MYASSLSVDFRERVGVVVRSGDSPWMIIGYGRPTSIWRGRRTSDISATAGVLGRNVPRGSGENAWHGLVSAMLSM